MQQICIVHVQCRRSELRVNELTAKGLVDALAGGTCEQHTLCIQHAYAATAGQLPEPLQRVMQ